MSFPTVDDALRWHRSGDYEKAEFLYRGILAGQPEHADALHLLGMLKNQMGCGDEAEALIRRAILIQPVEAVFHCNLGIVLAAGGKLELAIAEYRIAESLDSKSCHTLNNLGVALHASGAVAEAIECFKRAVICKPDDADARSNLLAIFKLDPAGAAAHHALGDLLQEANRSPAAIDFYRQAIALNPGSVQTHNNLGNAWFSCGKYDDALLSYQRALELMPDFAQAINNLANVLKELGRLDEAIAAYHRAIDLQPLSAEPLTNLGNALRDAGRWDQAMNCYQRALEIQPAHAVTYNNIGNAWCERGDWPVAVVAYESALRTRPDYADAINNLGTALEELGDRQRAMQCYRRANEMNPALVSPPWNMALLQLLNGDYENGWPGYENRWRQKKQSRTWREFKQPMLTDISQLKGSRILLHAEQGFGDAIQFCRYTRLVADEGATILLECPAKLTRLFSTLNGVSTVIARDEILPGFDLHCPLMSLPMVFKTEIKKVPGTFFYLAADSEEAARWGVRFGDDDAVLRVGLVWAGQGSHQKDRQRSLSLDAFGLLGDVPGVRFFSLQVGEAGQQASAPPGGMQLVDWTGELGDFADTAGLISQLDLVISVDTAVCHLTGALGKPIWILLAFQPDWRWLLSREDSPWYPTAKLFRQPIPDDWATPLGRIKSELQRLSQTPGCRVRRGQG